VPGSYSLLDMYLIKHTLMRITNDDVFRHIREQSAGDRVLKNGFSSKPEQLTDKLTAPQQPLSSLLTASIVN
jgi:hypothetical protein